MIESARPFPTRQVARGASMGTPGLSGISSGTRGCTAVREFNAVWVPAVKV